MFLEREGALLCFSDGMFGGALSCGQVGRGSAVETGEFAGIFLSDNCTGRPPFFNCLPPNENFGPLESKPRLKIIN